MPYTTIRTDRDGPVTRVSLNRPDVRNAFNDATIGDLTEAFGALAADESVRVVVLRGEGKVFCAGADVAWMRASVGLSEEENRRDAERMAAMLRAIDECPKPVIGRVHGAALGGGTGLAAACDIVVAAEGTKFAFSEVRLGILPAVISAFVLPKIGEAAARRLFLTAETFDAAFARSIGLVHEVVPEERLVPRVGEIAAALVANGPRAVGEAKALIRAVRGKPKDDWIAYSVATIARVRTSAEGQEGLKAFLEKRPPAWSAGRDGGKSGTA